MTIDDLLIRARKMGASDVHVTVGIPPKCRVNGELVTLMEGRILPADSKALVEQMIPGRLVERFTAKEKSIFPMRLKAWALSCQYFQTAWNDVVCYPTCEYRNSKSGITWPAAVRFGTGQEKAWSDFSYRTDRKR